LSWCTAAELSQLLIFYVLNSSLKAEFSTKKTLEVNK
jgi:hypothetical protein